MILVARAKFIRVPIRDATPDDVMEQEVDLCEFVRDEYRQWEMPEGQERTEIDVFIIAGM